MWLLRPPAACRQPPPHPRPALAPTSLAATVSLNCLPTSSFFSSSFLNSSFSASSRNCGQAGAEADAWWQAAWCRAPQRCWPADGWAVPLPRRPAAQCSAPSGPCQRARCPLHPHLGNCLLVLALLALLAACRPLNSLSQLSLLTEEAIEGPRGLAWEERRDHAHLLLVGHRIASSDRCACQAQQQQRCREPWHRTLHGEPDIGCRAGAASTAPCKGLAASVSAAKPFRSAAANCQLPRMIYDC